MLLLAQLSRSLPRRPAQAKQKLQRQQRQSLPLSELVVLLQTLRPLLHAKKLCALLLVPRMRNTAG